MGNSLVEEIKEKRKKYLDKIQNLNLPILDIGQETGSTGYLDFIKPNDIGTNNIMKGKDHLSRSFFVFRAELEYPNGLKKKTFTTFFQRYPGDNSLWHCCGQYGIILMSTDGGANIEQIQLLYELFSSGEYKINKDLINEQRLNFKINNDSMYDDLTDDDYPIYIRLGNTI